MSYSKMNRQTKKSQAVDPNILVTGKIPPQDIELEKAVLGAILMQKGIFDIAISILRPNCFYSHSNILIFEAMISLAFRNAPIDILTLVDELRTKGQLDECGGPFYIAKLTDNVREVAHIEAHCRLVLEKHMARELIRSGLEAVQMGYSDEMDIFEAVNTAEQSISSITNQSIAPFTKVDQSVYQVMRDVENRRNSGKELVGVTSGFQEIDKLTCGWQAPDLIVLAARPSVGKTAFALNLAANACASGVGVGFFSLEMSKSQLTNRLISAASGINISDIMRGTLTDQGLAELYKSGATPVSKLPLFIDDTSSLNVYQLRAKARRMCKEGAGLVIVDYLQLMSGIDNGRNSNREQEISKISRDLKGLAKELQVPIIALSQLSRSVESRADKMPVLSDLRESGAIEQDADSVIFMYRPEYYGNKFNEAGESLAGETHFRWAKHRNGALETVKLTANLAIQKFFDYKGSLSGSWKPIYPEGYNPDLRGVNPF